MLIRDVMHYNVITIPSSTSLAEARRIMDFHRLRRLPVVDKSKLVGIVSRDGLEKAGPSKLTTFSIHEITYLLEKLTVREVMRTDLLTVSPDTTVEEAVTLAQEKQVGSVLVVEDGHLVGIATTNDFFYKIVNPILGIGKPGVRISVDGCRRTADVAKVLRAIGSAGAEAITVFAIPHPDTGMRVTLHLDTDDPFTVIEALEMEGYEARRRG